MHSMTDIYAGIAIMATIAVLLALLGLRAGRCWSRRRVFFMAVLTVAFMLLFGTQWLDSIWMIHLLPVSNAIVVANWLLPATGLLIGLTWHLLPRPVWRKCLFIVPLAAIAVWRFHGPLSGRPPEDIQDRWNADVCLQSSSSSCGAAAAATLLRAAGIPATEAEMADLCLTRPHGTTLHGLYRGLKLKTSGGPWRVELVSTPAALRASAAPVLINVGLPRATANLDPRYQREWGWTPGSSHTVVLFAFLPTGTIDMADPAVGRERWFTADLDVLWRHQGLRLVRR